MPDLYESTDYDLAQYVTVDEDFDDIEDEIREDELSLYEASNVH